MIPKLAPILLSLSGLATSGLLLAADSATLNPVTQKVEISHTDTLNLLSGGVLRLQHTFGEVSIEGWDRPQVEIVTIKSTKDFYEAKDLKSATAELQRVHTTAELSGKDVVITAGFPHVSFPPSLPWTEPSIDVEYRIKVPMDAAMEIQHGAGEVHLSNVSADVHADVRNGTITLDLAPESQYAIQAKSDWGDVISDFPGKPHRRFWLIGHQFTGKSGGAHKLVLTAGYGDIVILKAWKPEATH
jgi:hypothetical protein